MTSPLRFVDTVFPITWKMLANASLADQAFFVCPAGFRYEVVAIAEVHSVLGTDAGAVSLQVTKDTSTDVPGGGTDLLTNGAGAGFNLKAAINVPQAGTLSTVSGVLQMKSGDRLSVDFAGTLTAVAGVVVTVLLRRTQ